MKFIRILILSTLFIGALLEDFSNLNGEYACNGDQREYPSDWDQRSFQTPPKDDTLGNYRETYQDMHYLVGYSQLLYSSDKRVYTINFITRVNPKLGTEGADYKILYTFDTIEQEDNSYTITSDKSYPNGMPISARIVDNSGNQIAKLVLEDEYFMWDNPTVIQGSLYENGQKDAIVEMFG